MLRIRFYLIRPQVSFGVIPQHETMKDFTITRRLVAGFEPWIAALVAPHLPFQKVPAKGGSYYWRFRDENAHALLVGKLVRAVTGLRGALVCVDASMTTEAFSLLRMVSDYADEVIAVSEGLVDGKLTKTQQTFVEQYFRPIPETADEHAAQPYERYVTREELMKSHRRLAEKTTGGGAEILKLARYVQKGYDTYVHGGYETAMELFRGDEQRFMLGGHDSPKYICLAYTSIAAKLMPVLVAFEFSAFLHGLDALRTEIKVARKDLDDSGEGLSAICKDEALSRQAAV